MSSERIRIVGGADDFVEDGQDQGEDAHALVDRLRDELSERTADLDVARDELRAAQSGSASFRKVRELTQLRDTMLEELERARAELGLRASRIAGAQADADAARARATEVERENQKLQRELGQLIDRTFELEDLLNDTDSGEIHREVRRLRKDNARLQAAQLQTPMQPPAHDAAPIPPPPPTQALALEPLEDVDRVEFSADDRERLETERDTAREEVEALEHQLREVWAKLEDTARDLDRTREEALELDTMRREFGQLQRQRDELRGQVEEQRDKIRQLATMASSETYEREMAVARELLDGLEKQCERAESRAAGYKTELIELRAINADLRTRLSAFGRRLAASRPGGRGRDLSGR